MTGILTTMDPGVAGGEAFLTPSGCIRIMTYPAFADVAELADAQVSEACDGDIVEVQVLSSAPQKTIQRLHGTSVICGWSFSFRNFLPRIFGAWCSGIKRSSSERGV